MNNDPWNNIVNEMLKYRDYYTNDPDKYKDIDDTITSIVRLYDNDQRLRARMQSDRLLRGY
jgi:hypothetical protein